MDKVASRFVGAIGTAILIAACGGSAAPAAAPLSSPATQTSPAASGAPAAGGPASQAGALPAGVSFGSTGKVCGETSVPDTLPQPLTGGEASGLRVVATALFTKTGPAGSTATVAGVVKNETSSPKSAALLIRLLDPSGNNVLSAGADLVTGPDGQLHHALVAYVADAKPGGEAAFSGAALERVPASSKIEVKVFAYPGQVCQQPFELVGAPQFATAGFVGSITGKLKNSGKDPASADVTIVLLDGAGRPVSTETADTPPGLIGPGQTGGYQGVAAGQEPPHTGELVSILPSSSNAGGILGAGLYFPGLRASASSAPAPPMAAAQQMKLERAQVQLSGAIAKSYTVQSEQDASCGVDPGGNYTLSFDEQTSDSPGLSFVASSYHGPGSYKIPSAAEDPLSGDAVTTDQGSYSSSGGTMIVDPGETSGSVEADMADLTGGKLHVSLKWQCTKP